MIKDDIKYTERDILNQVDLKIKKLREETRGALSQQFDFIEEAHNQNESAIQRNLKLVETLKAQSDDRKEKEEDLS